MTRRTTTVRAALAACLTAALAAPTVAFADPGHGSRPGDHGKGKGGPIATQPTRPTPPVTPQAIEGTLPDGATYALDVPTNWTGEVILHSHGFRTGAVNPTRDAGFAPTAAALLERGYAVVQSSYSRTGWALGTAADDQLDALAAFRARFGTPTRTIALGRSMGGLVTAMLAERADAPIDGAIPTCGLMGGGLNLNNYQLDGAQAAATLLLPGEQITLTKFASEAEAAAEANRLVAAVKAAQETAGGRARIALAASLMNMPTWSTGATPPAADDAVAIEKAQYDFLIGTFPLVMTRRVDIEQVSDGDSGYNKGVDYARLLAASAQRKNVESLYAAAGLDLTADLARITAEANVTADPQAVTWMKRTSTPTGRIRVPVLSMHTIADPAAPVEYENEYQAKIRRAGKANDLRLAFVQRVGHCTFTPAENLAAIAAMQERLDTGRWTKAVRTEQLQSTATALNLGGAAFVNYRAPRFVNDRADRFPYALPAHGPRR